MYYGAITATCLWTEAEGTPTNMKILINGVIAILIIDVTGFIFWALSGQYPVDNFYIGSITAHVLRAIF